jgi:Protein of unknown function (DUF1116)
MTADGSLPSEEANAAGFLAEPPRVVAVGAGFLAEAISSQAAVVSTVDWRPPVVDADRLSRVLADPRRREANSAALGRILASRAHLVDLAPARDALRLEPGVLLHAGPPIDWERASGPLRGALIGAALFEGLAGTSAEAEKRLAEEITLVPCHERSTVGPMAGVVSPSMWMFVLEDPSTGQRSYCSLNEGLGKVLRYGAYSPDVIERLDWMSSVLGPLVRDAIRRHGPYDVSSTIAQMVQMGDEGHNRNRAGTLTFLRDILPYLAESTAPPRDVAAVARFIGGNDHFFLNLVMPACKLALDAARDLPGSTLVVAMARNGTDFGIQVAGCGDAWFTAPAAVPEGLYLGAYGAEDANPDIGDSAITETAGLGGFAMAAAPAIVRFVGGAVMDAIRTTQEMYEITLGEHPLYQVPVLGFRGTPVGIDTTRVVRTGLLPQINTGIAGKIAGMGQVGAGLVRPPVECFIQALDALAAAAPELAVSNA